MQYGIVRENFIVASWSRRFYICVYKEVAIALPDNA